MSKDLRRHFLKTAGTTAAAGLFRSTISLDAMATLAPLAVAPISVQPQKVPADHTLRIAAAPIEIAPKHTISGITDRVLTYSAYRARRCQRVHRKRSRENNSVK